MDLKSSRGQAMVEMALILPVLLMLILSIVEFGLVFNHYLTLQNASREAARSASIGASDAVAAERAREVSPQLDQARLTIVFSPTGGSRKRGDSVTVTVRYTHQLITPVVSDWVGDAIVLEASTRMRVE